MSTSTPKSWTVERGPSVQTMALLAAPLALAVMEVFHPRPAGVADSIAQGGWFFWFHMIQLVLIGVVTLAAYLLTAHLDSRLARASRWGLGVFAVFFSAYDAAAGIATGLVWQNAQESSAAEQAAIFEVTKDLPGLSLVFILSLIGTGGWLLAMITSAMALRRNGAPRGPFVLLILAGVFLMLGHPFPGGTLAFGCFFAAAVWLQRTGRPSALGEAP